MSLGFVAYNSPTHEGRINTWFTPFSHVKCFGDFDLDPCTQSFRPFDTAKNHICEDLGGCGLSQEWRGRIWLNPPYGKQIGLWLQKMAEHQNGIALVFSRTETRWAQSAIESCDAVFFLKGRIKFLNAQGKTESTAANGNMYLIWGGANVKAVQKSGLIGQLFLTNQTQGGDSE